ncbi:MAG TPA: helix-hairpin-helix domain-containing protein [Bacteroidetes bacterium]|nr:helix-hairpin-helix domain-containing protein [Bacteroidota bacterium]
MNVHPFFLFCLFSFSAFGQTDTLPLLQAQEDLLESYFQEQETDEGFDYNDLYDELNYLRDKPLDLNSLSANELDLFPFLTALQKAAYLEYIEKHGPLISEYELQAIPHFDIPTIKQFLQFVTINDPNIAPLPSNWQKDGQHQLLMRWSKTLQAKRGFIENENTGEPSPYTGDENAFYLRYRYMFTNRLSFGFTAEKDAGETFFSGNNKQGFDFYSAHIFINNPNGKIRTVALGDYSVSMGQGLVLFNGFSTRKSPLTTKIKRSARPLRRYSSVNEADFFRGAATTVRLNKNIGLTAFFSTKKRDANIGEEEDLPDELPPVNFITSLQTSGKHRTLSEIEDKNSIRQSTVGGILKWRKKRGHIAANFLYNKLDKPLNRRAALYSQDLFNGNKLFNTSIDYSYTFRNYHFFGETALSGNGGTATSNGLIMSLDPKIDLAFLYRNFQKEHQALTARPFAETSGATNEKGIYLGMEIRPFNEWTINIYYDQWKHEWLRFRTDAPSVGHEWLVKINYKIRHKLEAHIQLKKEVKSLNIDSPDGRFNQIFPGQNFQGRVHLSYNLNKALEWRSRFYAGFSKIKKKQLNGVAFYQDLKYKPFGSPFSFTTRFAIFDTDDFAIRFYAYENDVLNSFTVAPYSGRGSRFYFNARVRLSRGVLIEGRWARTYFTDKNTIGSGFEEIKGPAKTDVKVQMRINF